MKNKSHRKSAGTQPKHLHSFVFYKPFGVLSQFTASGAKPSLKDFGPFPPDAYPVGRLDFDSEGMLILTNDNRLKHHLTDPRFGHPRTYLVQIERTPDEQSLALLRDGVVVQHRRTRPASVLSLPEAPDVPPRPVPIRFRKTVPTHWLMITLTEGRNRQVRRMTAAVGHPALRLIRIRIGNLGLGDLGPGMMRQLSEGDIAELLERDKNPKPTIVREGNS